MSTDKNRARRVTPFAFTKAPTGALAPRFPKVNANPIRFSMSSVPQAVDHPLEQFAFDRRENFARLALEFVSGVV